MTITINHNGHYRLDTGDGFIIEDTVWLPETFLEIACRSKDGSSYPDREHINRLIEVLSKGLK